MPQLKKLEFERCTELKSVPEKLLRSTTLEELSIVECPILVERYKKYTGQDWSLVSHIPSIKIGGYYGWPTSTAIYENRFLESIGCSYI